MVELPFPVCFDVVERPVVSAMSRLGEVGRLRQSLVRQLIEECLRNSRSCRRIPDFAIRQYKDNARSFPTSLVWQREP